jgi:hypothetical protein
VISAILGHAQISTTMDIYGHVLDDTLRGAAEKSVTRNAMLVDWFWSSLVLSILLLWLLWHWPQLWLHLQTTTLAAARERLLKPRTPPDCPRCRQARATAADQPPSRIPVTPWRERKSRRGAMGRILTQPFACPNRACLYYQITNADIHALLGDGAHGQHERRETLRCPPLRHDLHHTPLLPSG